MLVNYRSNELRQLFSIKNGLKKYWDNCTTSRDPAVAEEMLAQIERCCAKLNAWRGHLYSFKDQVPQTGDYTLPRCISCEHCEYVHAFFDYRCNRGLGNEYMPARDQISKNHACPGYNSCAAVVQELKKKERVK